MFETYAEAANDQKNSGFPPADPLNTHVQAARLQQNAYLISLNQDLPEILKSADYAISGPQGDIPVRMIYPTLKERLPCIIFIRGAGFWAGNLETHARTMRSLAKFSACAVCAVDYRRTPEYLFPTQRDEIIAVMQWLKSAQEHLGIDANTLVLFGESAGATIALSVALTLRDQQDHTLAGLGLFYCNAGGPKATARAYSQWVWEQYLGHSGPSTDSNAVPLLDPMHGLPPVWLGVGEDDPLIIDSEELYGKLLNAGSEVHLRIYPDLPHAFIMYSGNLLPAYHALQEAALACGRFFKQTDQLMGGPNAN